VRYVERITDLPIEHSRILEKLNLDSASNPNTLNNKSYDNLEHSLDEEKYDNFYNEYFNSPNETNNEQKSQNSNASNKTSSKSTAASKNQFKVTSNSGCYQNLEYETITTSVPESLAKKIIEEAEAAGAINRTTKF
jgi:hypothetical protein